MRKWRPKYNFYGVKPMPASEAIEHCIESAPDYGDGAIESMGRELREAKRILGMIVEALPDGTQAAILTQLSYEEVEHESPKTPG